LNPGARSRDQWTRGLGCAVAQGIPIGPERIMNLNLRGKTAGLVVASVLALIVVSASLLVLAGARESGRDADPQLEAKLEAMRAARATQAEAALKLQGGSRILLKLDSEALREAIAIGLRDDVRRMLREERVPFSGAAARDGGVEMRVRDAKDRERALSKLEPLLGVTQAGGRKVDVADNGDGLVRLTPTETDFADRLRGLRQQSVEVIEQRLANFGVAAAGVQQDGTDRIRILLPGVKAPDRFSTLFSKRARITFRLVDVSMSAAEAQQGTPPSQSEVLYALNSKDPYLVSRQVVMEGGEIIDAAPGFDQATNQPIVSFRFSANGTRRFAEITRDNVGRPFAIVLDNEVLSAPVIREPILGGSGQISGNFTLEDANTIAMLLRSGALPGRLIVIEQQIVEPEAAAKG
jgi:preprotein translocase subunit SecD